MRQLFLITILSAISFSSFAHTNSVVFNDIISAMKSGDASQLSNFFDAKVEISLNDEDEMYSKTEAADVMKRFFSNAKPSAFTKEHEGTSPSGANYCIGILKTTKGTFRVFIHAKAVSGKKIIQQIQIERE